MPKGIKKKTKEKSAAGPLEPNRGSSTSKLGTASQRLAFKLASGLFKVVDCDEQQPPGNFGIKHAWAVVPHNVQANGKPRLAAEFGRDFMEIGFRRPRDGADCDAKYRSGASERLFADVRYVHLDVIQKRVSDRRRDDHQRLTYQLNLLRI